MPLEETVGNSTNSRFEYTKRLEELLKIEFIKLLSLSKKESYFNFSGKLYKQVDAVAMGSPLSPTLADLFLVYF